MHFGETITPQNACELSSTESLGSPQGSIRKGGGGAGTQKFVYQQWPDEIFPTANFVLSHDGHFWRGGLQGGGGAPPPRVYGHSNTSLGLPLLLHEGAPGRTAHGAVRVRASVRWAPNGRRRRFGAGTADALPPFTSSETPASQEWVSDGNARSSPLQSPVA